MNQSRRTSPKPSDVLVISPLARVRWVSGCLEISAAGSEVGLSTSDVEALAVLHAFSRARRVREVQADFPAIRADDLLTVVSELQAAAVLLAPQDVAEIESHHWDIDALAFHRRSRTAVVAVGAAPTSPPTAPACSTEVIELDRTPNATQREFLTVLDARSSRRSWPAAPMRDSELARFLWLSARNRANGNSTDRPIVVSRPYPSGGAAYSLELYPVLAPESVIGVPAGVYRYRPEAHALDPVSTRPDHYVPVLAAARATVGTEDSVPVAIVITSRFERTSSSYGELAYSLVLKDVGGLFQTMYLVAEYLGLAACALGGGSPDPLISELIGASDLAEPVVGEFIVAPRADKPASSRRHP